GQLGVSWNGIGGTNYITITNGGALYLSEWSSKTLGAPGSGPTNIGIMDIEYNSQVVVTNNQLGFMNTLVTNGQLIALGGQAFVQVIYNPTLNITVLVALTAGPPIFVQLNNVVVALSATATFSAAVNEGGNFNYQWFFNNQPLTDGNGISGSKTTTLTITDVTAADVGNYSVLVTLDSQRGGASASLSTDAITLYPVVTIKGNPGNTYEVDYSTSLSSPVWTPLTTVILASYTQYVVDTNSPMSIKRFYRVIQK
ncbi:MAG TPA: immunoglobulin domain-containing protein, partial [Candidatus Angelobacter sp.]|nr:immunoglobulin domain-containing protein [Candidatus Angelobacter sp.]